VLPLRLLVLPGPTLLLLLLRAASSYMPALKVCSQG
jgi:hypothetical protein